MLAKRTERKLSCGQSTDCLQNGKQLLVAGAVFLTVSTCKRTFQLGGDTRLGRP
jgi:hypothetical protein